MFSNKIDSHSPRSFHKRVLRATLMFTYFQNIWAHSMRCFFEFSDRVAIETLAKLDIMRQYGVMEFVNFFRAKTHFWKIQFCTIACWTLRQNELSSKNKQFDSVYYVLWSLWKMLIASSVEHTWDWCYRNILYVFLVRSKFGTGKLFQTKRIKRWETNPC